MLMTGLERIANIFCFGEKMLVKPQDELNRAVLFKNLTSTSGVWRCQKSRHRPTIQPCWIDAGTWMLLSENCREATDKLWNLLRTYWFESGRMGADRGPWPPSFHRGLSSQSEYFLSCSWQQKGICSIKPHDISNYSRISLCAKMACGNSFANTL